MSQQPGSPACRAVFPNCGSSSSDRETKVCSVKLLEAWLLQRMAGLSGYVLRGQHNGNIFEVRAAASLVEECRDDLSRNLCMQRVHNALLANDAEIVEMKMNGNIFAFLSDPARKKNSKVHLSKTRLQLCLASRHRAACQELSTRPSAQHAQQQGSESERRVVLGDGDNASWLLHGHEECGQRGCSQGQARPHAGQL